MDWVDTPLDVAIADQLVRGPARTSKNNNAPFYTMGNTFDAWTTTLEIYQTTTSGVTTLWGELNDGYEGWLVGHGGFLYTIRNTSTEYPDLEQPVGKIDITMPGTYNSDWLAGAPGAFAVGMAAGENNLYVGTMDEELNVKIARITYGGTATWDWVELPASQPSQQFNLAVDCNEQVHVIYFPTDSDPGFAKHYVIFDDGSYNQYEGGDIFPGSWLQTGPDGELYLYYTEGT